MSAYTDDDVQALAWHMGRDAMAGLRDETVRKVVDDGEWDGAARRALDAVAPAIAARTLREAARDVTRHLVCADCANDLDTRADEIEAGS
jgi:hypothetical protein